MDRNRGQIGLPRLQVSWRRVVDTTALGLESQFVAAADVVVADMANCIPFEDPLGEALEMAVLRIRDVGETVTGFVRAGRLGVVKRAVVAAGAVEERAGWVLDEFQWATESANGSLDFGLPLARSHGMGRDVEADWPWLVPGEGKAARALSGSHVLLARV